MISYFELHEFASRMIAAPAPSEADLRRGLSALYYALFHRLAQAGSIVFSGGGVALQSQAARAFNHNAMRNVCRAYVQSPSNPLGAPLNAPKVPDRRLLQVADGFVKLQAARHEADYEVRTTVTKQVGVELLVLANATHKHFTDVEHLPETRVFLTALLLADRWTRRG